MSAAVAAAAATAKEEGAQAQRSGVGAFVTVFDTLTLLLDCATG